jgi:hypothetical protein
MPATSLTEVGAIITNNLTAVKNNANPSVMPMPSNFSYEAGAGEEKQVEMVPVSEENSTPALQLGLNLNQHY